MIAFLVPATAAIAKSLCKEDKAKFCKDVKASGKKVNDCLKEHSAELASACKEFLDKPKEAKPGKEGKQGKKGGGKPGEAKPAEGKPSEAKPTEEKAAETKPAEPAPSESAPSAPASPGGAETKP